MSTNPDNKDALSGNSSVGGNSPPANPSGYNGSPLAAFQMEETPTYIELETYRKKGINAYLVKEGLTYEHNMYGEALPGQEDAAHKGKKHTVRVRIDILPDGRYKYKEAGGASFTKSRYGWILLKDGGIIDEG